MTDFIWTLIIIWLIVRLFDMFRAAPARKRAAHNDASPSGRVRKPGNDALRKAVREHVNREGEYIDYEEVK